MKWACSVPTVKATLHAHTDEQETADLGTTGTCVDPFSVMTPPKGYQVS